mmetsp:Transcript_2418/g.4626  ORF Transcript_2418/g.4626 Transcript_2418/m.4626 type:complete len:134 (+) Transcript_2418:467-868(+)
MLPFNAPLNSLLEMTPSWFRSTMLKTSSVIEPAFSIPPAAYIAIPAMPPPAIAPAGMVPQLKLPPIAAAPLVLPPMTTLVPPAADTTILPGGPGMRTFEAVGTIAPAGQLVAPPGIAVTNCPGGICTPGIWTV